MKELIVKIMDMIQAVPEMDKNTTIGIAMLIKNEKQAREMISFLSEIDLKNSKQSPIIKKALEINGAI